MRIQARQFGALVLAGTALAACGNSSTSANGNGRMAVQMTDSPFPYGQIARADIFVVRIDAKEAVTDSLEDSDETQMSGWTTIATPNTSINIFSLIGGKTTNFGVGTLATGTYQSFRVIIDASKSSITLTDGTMPPIKWPSAAHTGIKVVLDEPIAVTADSSLMILDFDLGRSFVLRGNSINNNGFLFKPVIRAIAKELTGSASGSVHDDTPTGPAAVGATVEVLKAGASLTDTASADVVRSTETDANGNFMLDFLLPSIYVLRVTPLASTTYQPVLLTGGLTITSGVATAGLSIVVTH